MKTIYQDRYANLINTLVLIRKNRKLTQFQVAQHLGKPQSYIAKIEKRERKLDVLEFIQLCETLEVSPSEIIALV
ncbi:helix-turn-helix domain-containing protein [Moraxella sp. ZJ142]|uniref:helix-turn-helix domain-containing protein n=1 Tax=Moraxella marmotae TaxID=3344520 RepID=UPI0035D4B12E